MRSSCRIYTLFTLLVGTVLLIAGCGGGGGGGGDTTPPVQRITGKATLNGAGLAGVTLAVSGTTSGTVTTDAGGDFQTGAVQDGNYTITPSKAGYSFSPASQAITVAGGSVTLPQFSATATGASYIVSGQVKLNGAALSGVSVTISGAATASATTDAGGIYSFSSVPNGTCTVTPVLAGYTFAPLNRTVTVAGANMPLPDFDAVAAPAVYTVSGRVTVNNSGVAGVSVSISGGGSGNVVTDAGGYYSFPAVQNGNYTITPSLTGYNFTPASRSVSVNGGDSGGHDFSALPVSGGSIIIDFG